MNATRPLPVVFVSPRQLADRWGISELTLRRWRAAGRIRAHAIGRAIRFSIEEVERVERESKI